MTKRQKIESDQQRAQMQAKILGFGVNDGHGTIWLPSDGNIPVCQPDYGNRY